MASSLKRMILWLCVPILTLLMVTIVSSQTQSAKNDNPRPRYPRYLAKPDMKTLLEAARVAVRQPTGRCPLGKMQSGQDAYVFFEYGQDMQVWEAIKTAWAERGVTAHAMGFWDFMGITKAEYDKQVQATLVRGPDAWKELGNFRVSYKPFFPENIRKEFGEPITDESVRTKFGKKFFDAHPEIKYYYAGQGGGNFWAEASGPTHVDKFMGNWVYLRPIDLLSKAAEFPPDLWNLTEEKILRPVPFVSDVTFEDPEGTNVAFSVTPDEAKQWAKTTGSSNHIYVYPQPLRSTVKPGSVIRASANHSGMYPSMTVHLGRHGVIERIDGGGKTGDLFRMLLNHPKFKAARFPKSPEPGYWFLRQDGYATNPKFVRSMPALVEGEAWMANRPERNRAGVQHLAFSYDSDDPADLAYAKKEGLPLGTGGEHTAHMHNYFATIRWKLRDTGEWMTVGDKGYVKAFDDPELRALAARYGDPDLVLRYEWIPAMPGINVPGNYDKDFAPDPWTWMVKEWEQIKAGSYQYYIDDYSLKRPRAGGN